MRLYFCNTVTISFPIIPAQFNPIPIYLVYPLPIILVPISKIKFAPGNVILAINDNNSTLFRVDQRAEFDSSDVQGNYDFTVSGEKSRGLYVADQGTTVKADGKDANSKVVFKVEGKDSTGIYVTSSAGKYGTATEGQVLLGENTTIYVAGENASAAVVDGTVFSVNGVALRKDTAILTSKATLTDSTVTFDKGVSGYRLINNGELQHTGKIDFTGQQAVTSGNAVGVYINGGHLNNMNGGEIVVNGIGVDIYGANSIVSNLGSVKAVNGIAAVRLNKDASLTVKGSSATDVIKGEKDADALLVHAGSVLTTSNAQIAVDGKGAGIHFLNMDQDGSGQFKLSGSGVITVKGNDATGILVEGEDGNKQPTMGTSDFISDNSSGLVINVEDVGGNGITVNTSGKVHSGASVNIQSKQGQSALVLKGDTTQITQSGNLSSNSETSAVVELKDLTSTQDINLTNLGSIKVSNDAAAPAGLIAINANIGKNISLTNGESNTSKGEIVGVVALGDQKNQVTLFGGSKADVITATAGETSIMLKDVQRSQSDHLFNKLSAGNGTNDSIELSASADKTSHYALTQAKADEIKGFEQLKIHANSTFELDNSDITLNESVPNGGIHLEDATGALFINQSQATGKNIFNHNLYGKGVVKTDINGQEFAFDATKANLIGDKFTGKLQLENAVFNLKNENTKALTDATLSIGQKAQTIVEDGIGKQSIGGLVFDGGRLTFNDNIPNMDTIGQVADGSIHAKDLDFTNAKGTVDIHVDSINNTPTFVTDKPILEQDIGESIVQLISADQVTGTLSGDLKLDIYDAKGVLVPQSGATITNDIEQSGKKVANGKYGYGLQSFKDVNSTAADGLYVSYKLTEIELLTKGDDALILHAVAGKTGNSVDLAAKITGSGDLRINTDSDYISLSNNTNNFTGTTIVTKGDLYLENDNVLGQLTEHSESLNIGTGTTANIFGKSNNLDGTSQIVGALNIVDKGELNLGAKGQLTVSGKSDSLINGSLKGLVDAKLIFDNAVGTVNSVNSDLQSDINLVGTSTVQMNNSQALGNIGTIFITKDSELKVANTEDKLGEFTKTLSGVGNFTVTTGVNNTNSVVTLVGDNKDFKGNVNIGNNADVASTKLLIKDEKSLGVDNTVNIANKGILFLTSNDQVTFNHQLKGTGIFATNLSGHELTMGKGSQFNGANFEGTLALTDTKFVLNGGDNTTAVTKAIVQANQKSIVTVADGKGVQNIGGLEINAGEVNFENKLSNLSGNKANGYISTGKLDTSKTGKLVVNLDNVHNTIDPTAVAILEQDDNLTLITLVEAKNYDAIANDLVLDIQYGTETFTGKHDETHEVIQNIMQGADIVAKGQYDYSLQRVKDTGLSIAYKLTQVELMAKNAAAFVLQAAAGKMGSDVDLSAKVIGSGDLIVKTESDYVSLSNKDNDYTGQTTVEKGDLYLEDNNVLGQTSNLIVGTNTTVGVFGKSQNTTGTSQIVGALNVDGTVDLSTTGQLIITGKSDSMVDGTLKGATDSKLVFNNAKGMINSTNTELDTRIDLMGTTILTANHSQSLGVIGQVNIDMNSELRVANSDKTIDFSKELMGDGQFTVIETGLSGVDSIVNVAGDNSKLTGNIVIGSNADSGKTILAITDEISIGSNNLVTINDKGTLSLTSVADTTFNHKLSGTGIMATNLSGNTLTMGNANSLFTGDNFKGTLSLTHTKYLLDGSANTNCFKECYVKNR